LTDEAVKISPREGRRAINFFHKVIFIPRKNINLAKQSISIKEIHFIADILESGIHPTGDSKNWQSNFFYFSQW
jgi:hypothetical protein